MAKKAGSLLVPFLVGVGACLGLFALVFGGIVSQYLIGLVGYSYNYSAGDRVGKIIEARHEGVFWRTWEITMAVTQSGASAETWKFSVDSADPGGDELVRKLRDSLRRGELIRVRYEQRFGARPWRSATSYLCRSIGGYGGR